MSKQISKTLSYLLRHDPQDLTIDEYGYVVISDILKKLSITFNELNDVVINNDKSRFKYNENKTKIKANQGHSIKIKHDFKKTNPPIYLYHGTPENKVANILTDGIKKMNRHHVHLSADKETAAIVGSRRGKFKILTISASLMNFDKYSFFISDNNVWLTDFVPAKYISV